MNLDFDFVYRRAIPNFLMGTWELFSEIAVLVKVPIHKRFSRIETFVTNSLFPEDELVGKSGDSSQGALWAAVLLAVYLIIYFA